MAKNRSSIFRTTCVLFLAGVLQGLAQQTATNPVAPDSGNPSVSPEVVKDLLGKASEAVDNGDLDEALRQVDAVIQLDVRNPGAYELRGAIYIKKKLWDLAENDYAKALDIDPSVVAYKYKLAEIKFLQKAYDAAKPRYAALEADPDLGDLATYMAFLCDLLAFHDDLATKDLAQMNTVEKRPSYYFGNYIWNSFHNKPKEANFFYSAATTNYGSHLSGLYLSRLKELNYLAAPILTFVTKDGISYDQARVFVEDDGLRVSTPHGWTSVPFAQLPDDLSAFPLELRTQIAGKRQAIPEAMTSSELLSFTAKNGKSYNRVKWSIDDSGVTVLTADGRATIPFEQLPDDLSWCPAELRDRIEAKRNSKPVTTADVAFLTFTTKKGDKFDRVKWSVGDDGLRILTPDGWITIPFDQLPDDLSMFPSVLRAKIVAGRQFIPDVTGNESLLTFTTKKGDHYDRVKWSVGDDGLRILTPDGWIAIPFEQLPEDISTFPGELQQKISLSLQRVPPLSSPITELPANPARPGDVGSNSSAGDKVGAIDPEQFNLQPSGAKDTHFGRCVALEASTLVVGCNGAIYVYVENKLQARLCPDPDSTLTGDEVNAIALSHDTIAACTRRGVYVWVGTSQGWKLQAYKNIANSGSVALDGDNLVVGTNGKGTGFSAVSFFTRTGETWQLAPRAANHDGDTYSADLFGHIVALKGTVALLGFPNWSQSAYDNVGPEYSGRAFIERFAGDIWKEEARLSVKEEDVGANQFGASVALSDDQIAVGSSNRDMMDYAPHHGVVYLFHHSNEGWSRQARITSPAPANDEGFGRAPIVICRQTLAVGDSGVNVKVPEVMLDNGQSSGRTGEIKKAGAVYVYENQALQATLLAPDPVDGLGRNGSPDHYAGSIAVDGDTIVIGAGDKDGGTGAVYLWKRTNTQWHLAAELRGFHKQPDFNY